MRHGRVGYGFDFDNTFLRTEALKLDMGTLCGARFPQVSPQTFMDIYFQYRLDHGGRVNMQEILEIVAIQAHLPGAERDILVNEWMKTLPYAKYVFRGAHQLIHDLGPEHVYLLTKSPDVVYQREKIAGSRLPLLDDEVHMWVTEVKNDDVFRKWVEMMKDQGITHLLYGSDEPRELQRAYNAAQEAGLGFDGVHHQYGNIWRVGLEGVEQTLGDQYHPARNFHAFARIVRGLQMTLEGQRTTIEWGVGRGKEHA